MMVELKDLNVWLKPDEVQDGDVILFADEGRIVKKEESGFEQDNFEIGVTLPNGMKRVWTMNKTAQRAVGRDYGTETLGWVGRAVKVKKVAMNVRGKTLDVITVEKTVPAPTVQAPAEVGE